LETSSNNSSVYRNHVITNIIKSCNRNDVFICGNKHVFSYREIVGYAEYLTQKFNLHEKNLFLISGNSEWVALLHIIVFLCGGMVIHVDSSEKSLLKKIINDHKPRKKTYFYSEEDTNLDLSELIYIDKSDIHNTNPLIYSKESYEEIIKGFLNNLFDKYLITGTSGTTGAEKIIIHSRFNLCAASFCFPQSHGSIENRTFLSYLSFSYLGGILNSLILPFLNNSSIYITNSDNVTMETMRGLSNRSFDSVWLPFSIIRNLYNLKFFDRVKGDYKIFAAFDSVDTNLKRKIWLEHGVRIYESYGTSEALFVLVESEKDNIFSSGRMLSCATLVEEKNNSQEIEMIIRSESTALNVNQPYFSGDIFEIKNNRFFFKRRIKDVIIKSGLNIYPSHIESFLRREIKTQHDFCALGKTDELLGQKFFLLIEGNSSEIIKENVKNLLIESFGKKYLPDSILFTDSFPRTRSGKVRKKDLEHLLNCKTF